MLIVLPIVIIGLLLVERMLALNWLWRNIIIKNQFFLDPALIEQCFTDHLDAGLVFRDIRSRTFSKMAINNPLIMPNGAFFRAHGFDLAGLLKIL